MTAPDSPASERTPAQDRTYRAIVLAAIGVLGGNRGASTREVAEAAAVARSTVHRYFPDRDALVAGIDAFVEDEYTRIAVRARPGDGTGLEALVRLCSELFDDLDAFLWWFLVADQEEVAALEDDPVVAPLVERGHADGTVDPRLPQRWVGDLVWSLLYSARTTLLHGEATRGEVRELFLHTLRKSVAV